MTTNDLLLLLLGSFLPNNIVGYLFKRAWRHRPRKGSVKLISPRRYYVKFESDPKTQYVYHRRMVKFWIANAVPMNIIVAVDIWATLNNRTEVALLMTALLLAINTNYSLYANFDTETGDAHAAYASIKADQIEAQQHVVAIPSASAFPGIVISPSED